MRVTHTQEQANLFVTEGWGHSISWKHWTMHSAFYSALSGLKGRLLCLSSAPNPLFSMFSRDTYDWCPCYQGACNGGRGHRSKSRYSCLYNQWNSVDPRNSAAAISGLRSWAIQDNDGLQTYYMLYRPKMRNILCRSAWLKMSQSTSDPCNCGSSYIAPSWWAWCQDTGFTDSITVWPSYRLLSLVDSTVRDVTLIIRKNIKQIQNPTQHLSFATLHA